RRSTSGSAQFLGDRLVSWSSKKQRSTTISTTEAEYIAMSRCYKMAEENVPAPSPKRSDKHILSFNAWLPVRKGNLLLYLQKLQKNPIFRILVDILQNTNFFRAFTASANVPTIYIQQFWNTLVQDAKTEVYSSTGIEQWFTLNADLLRKALEITPPWRAILSLINQCLNDKTSGSDKPQHPILQMLWGIVTRSIMDVFFLFSLSNVDYAELLWEEFVQAIQTFFTHRANLNIPTKKPTPHVILYCWFTKLIIYYLGSEHNIHRRPGSPVHVTGDDFLLDNLKFVPKGEKDEDQQKKTASKADKPKKPAPAKQPTLAEQAKPVKEKTSKLTPSKKIRKGITQRLPVVEEADSITQDAPTGPFAQPQDDTFANVV
ncbi:retrovirus-related pol polyprotein from transposon TNT 1-94, partial [Tanacetum coccineum]